MKPDTGYQKGELSGTTLPVHDGIDDPGLQVQQDGPRDVVLIVSLHKL